MSTDGDIGWNVVYLVINVATISSTRQGDRTVSLRTHTHARTHTAMLYRFHIHLDRKLNAFVCYRIFAAIIRHDNAILDPEVSSSDRCHQQFHRRHRQRPRPKRGPDLAHRSLPRPRRNINLNKIVICKLFICLRNEFPKAEHESIK